MKPIKTGGRALMEHVDAVLFRFDSCLLIIKFIHTTYLSLSLNQIMNKLHLIIFFFLTTIGLYTCKTLDLGQPDPIPNYEQEIQQWKNDQLASLMAPNGWLSLVGLFWLEEGENLCGSDPQNQVVLPRNAPPLVATYNLNNGRVDCTIEEHDGLSTKPEDNCNMRYQSLTWQLLERGGRHGVRIRDTLRPTYIRLLPMEYFDIDADYRVFAKWTAAAENDSLMMKNVLDMEYAIPVEGSLTFKLGGLSHTLTTLNGGPDDLFIVLSDDTTGDSTYGGGRYLYCPRPNDKGITIIDFNKTYNPPCAFTNFATCLLPLPENHLPIELRVGEKTYGDH